MTEHPEFRNKSRLASFSKALTAALLLSLPATAQLAPSDQKAVARLRVDVPEHDFFTMRATMPVPYGVFPRPDSKLPFAVRGATGQLFPTQLETVSRFPDGDFADVVEVIARVPVPHDLREGETAYYDVVRYLHEGRLHRQTEAIATLLGKKDSVVVSSKDCFGNRYELDVTHKTDSARLMKNGRHAQQYRFYGTMRPRVDDIGPPSGALKHFMGVHSYVTAWNLEDVLSIDLRFSNGASGTHSSPLNDPLDDLYFKSLDIAVPKGWVALPLFDDPVWGTAYNLGETHVQPIVRALQNQKLHVLPRQGQFHRRLVITPEGNEQRAMALLRQQGLGFCVDGVNGDGERLYSWWNPETAHYFPTNTRLPKLDWIGHDLVREWLTDRLASYESFLGSGQQQGNYPIHSPALGWAHPWGVKYGGMTGGAEIYPVDGVKTAYTGAAEGILLAQLTHRMYTERQPIALYSFNGDPSSVEDWLQVSPIKHMPMSYFQVLLDNEEPAGWENAQKFQVNHVVANQLQPNYEQDLRDHDPIDQQHYIRYSRSMKVLTWLSNDSLAKDDLELSGELVRLSYTQFPVSASGYISPSSLKADQIEVNNTPGVGFSFGRGPAWSIDCANACYAVARPEVRARILTWANSIVDLVEAGQGQCSGVIQSIYTNQVLGGKYHIRQAVEQTIIELALAGMRETIYKGVDQQRADRLDAILEKSINSMFTGVSWSDEKNGAWFSMAVDDNAQVGEEFCDFLPSDGASSGIDKNHPFSSLELGYRLNQDALWITRAGQVIGASSFSPGVILAKYEKTYFSYLENRAPLIATLQLLLEP